VSKTLAKRVAPSKPAAKKAVASVKAAPAAKKPAVAKKAAPAKAAAKPAGSSAAAKKTAVPQRTAAESKPTAAAVHKAAHAPAHAPAPAAAKPAARSADKPAVDKPALVAVPAATPEPVAAALEATGKTVSPAAGPRKAESDPPAVPAPKRTGTPALTVVTSAMPPRPTPPAMPARPAPPTSFEPQRSAIKVDPKLVNVWKSKPGSQLSDEELLAMPDSEYMNEKQLEFFRTRLEGQRESLLSNAGETTEHLREDTSIVPDPADRATIEEEHALELRTRDRERKLLKKISQALARIEAGEYGFCDETGEPIGLPRLIARPTATLSLEAQQRRELKQRLFGD
jgi:DnaK suppressor protein